MPIDMKPLTPIEFCVLVLWVKGLTTGKITETLGARLGSSSAKIRGIIKNRMSMKRADMDIEQRQRVLNALKQERKDDGKLADSMFVASPIVSKAGGRRTPAVPAYRPPKASQPVTQDISSVSVSLRKRSARSANKHAAKKAEEERIKREEEAQIRRQFGHAPRGIEIAPLEYMLNRGMLDPDQERGSLVASAVERTRFKAAEKLRAAFQGAQISGVKSQSLEFTGGGGGMGEAIPARVQEAISIVTEISKLMSLEDFYAVRALLVTDEFIWRVPSKKASKIVLTALLRSLDAVALFYGMINEDAYRTRWGRPPRRGKPKTKQATRKSSSRAKELIAEGEKSLK